MTKAKINNEIILLRKSVDQARVHVIKKLARDAFKLRQKKGTEAQKAKNSRKADRIAAEICSVKKVKRDEITKHVLTNTTSLKEILENKNSEPLTRIMTRIANHKTFSKKISEFKAKYPHYMEFLGPGRKKKANLERKEKRKLKGSKDVENGFSSTNDESEESNKSNNIDTPEKSEDLNDELNVNSIEHSEKEDEIDSNDEISPSEHKYKNKGKVKKDEDSGNLKTVKKVTKKTVKTDFEESNMIKEKSRKSLLSQQKKVKKEEEQTTENHSEPKISKKKTNTSKVISKQAIVKKFTDILKEDDSKSDKIEIIETESVESNLKVEKEVDPFFVTGDGETNYLSVALPKSNLKDNDDDYDNHTNKFSKRKFSQQQNDKFFSKVPKFKTNSSKFDSSNSESRWQSQENNVKFKEKVGNKKDFKKFNGDHKNKSKPLKKQSKSDFANKGNETLHPSWEAKKKQQDILKKGFQGKKIVFDD